MMASQVANAILPSIPEIFSEIAQLYPFLTAQNEDVVRNQPMGYESLEQTMYGEPMRQQQLYY